MHNRIDELGLIKFDILGNGSLSVLRDTLRQNKRPGSPDPQVWGLEKCYADPAVQAITVWRAAGQREYSTSKARRRHGSIKKPRRKPLRK